MGQEETMTVPTQFDQGLRDIEVFERAGAPIVDLFVYIHRDSPAPMLNLIVPDPPKKTTKLTSYRRSPMGSAAGTRVWKMRREVTPCW